MWPNLNLCTSFTFYLSENRIFYRSVLYIFTFSHLKKRPILLYHSLENFSSLIQRPVFSGRPSVPTQCSKSRISSSLSRYSKGGYPIPRFGLVRSQWPSYLFPRRQGIKTPKYTSQIETGRWGENYQLLLYYTRY